MNIGSTSSAKSTTKTANQTKCSNTNSSTKPTTSNIQISMQANELKNQSNASIAIKPPLIINIYSIDADIRQQPTDKR